MHKDSCVCLSDCVCRMFIAFLWASWSCMVRCFEIAGLLSVSPQLKPSLIAVSSQLDIVSESCRFSMTLANASLPKYVMSCTRLITNSMKSTATFSNICLQPRADPFCWGDRRRVFRRRPLQVRFTDLASWNTYPGVFPHFVARYDIWLISAEL